MEERFAIKRPGAWLWWGKLTREQVLARLDGDRLTRDWLICPLGSAEYAVTIGQFVDDPAIFLRMKQGEADRESLRRSIVASVEKPALLRAGQNLLKLFFLCLLIRGAIVKIFFPQMRGAGLTPTALAILIPIWSVGGAGLLALALGWLQYQYRVRLAERRQTALTADRTGDPHEGWS